MTHQSETKNCQNCKKDFVIEPEDFNFYEKIKVPPPTFCPMCRAERRLAYRNERKLFKVNDSLTGEIIFSLYPDRSTKNNFTQKEWFSDDWNELDTGREYDFSRPFFEQFAELESVAPIFPLRVERMENSPYCANATSLKNSYLCFNSSYSENCMYGNATDFSKECVDNSHINQSERCYECFWVRNCYQCYFTMMSWDSRNLWFCRDCGSCNDCFGCANLRNSSYCIFNKKYTKEEYEIEIKKMKLETVEGIVSARAKAKEFWNTQIVRHQQGIRNLNSTGSYVTDSKNVNESFLVREGEDLKFCQYLQVPKSKDCYDVTAWGDGMELHYETCLSGSNSYNLKFSTDCWPNCKNLEYCSSMFSSSDCFGCVGLKKKQYCIFNKQYTKEEYEKLALKIKKQMNEMPYIDKAGRVYKYGEFFPIEYSPFGYNNSTAIQFFPITEDEAERKSYTWIEVPRGEYAITIKAPELPNSLQVLGEGIIKEVLECTNCKNPYRILENEFLFYKNENLPPPTMCNDCRFERRIKDRLKLQLYERKCMCNKGGHFHEGACVKEFKTGYAPDRPEIIYCEKCYQQEVY